MARFTIWVLILGLFGCTNEVIIMGDEGLRDDQPSRPYGPGLLNYPMNQAFKLGNDIPLVFQPAAGAPNNFVLGQGNKLNIIKPQAEEIENPQMITIAANIVSDVNSQFSSNVEIFQLNIQFGSGNVGGLQEVNVDLPISGVILSLFGNAINVNIGAISTDLSATGVPPSRGLRAQASIAYGSRPSTGTNRVSVTFPPTAVANGTNRDIPVFGMKYVSEWQVSFAPDTAAGVLIQAWSGLPGVATSVLLYSVSCPAGVVTRVPNVATTEFLRLANTGATPLTNVSIQGILYL